MEKSMTSVVVVEIAAWGIAIAMSVYLFLVIFWGCRAGAVSFRFVEARASSSSGLLGVNDKRSVVLGEDVMGVGGVIGAGAKDRG
jgi:hypothetical protein